MIRTAAATVLAVAFAGAVCASATSAQEPVSAREQAAAEVVDLLNAEATSAASLDVMIRSMTENNPAMASLADLMHEFFAEFMSWEILRPEYVKIYAESFTEAELHDLAAFLRSPTGRRWAELTPQIMQESAGIADRLLQPHIPELQRRIMMRMNGM